MGQAINPGNLSDAVQKILKHYEDDLNGNLAAVTLSVARETAKRLNRAAKAKIKGTGEYVKGWGTTTQNERLTKKAVVHHKTEPGLPHLLEYGHIALNGKRVGMRPHIADVENEVVELYQKEILSKL